MTGIEYTTPGGYLTAGPGRLPVRRPHRIADTRDVFEQAQRRYDAAKAHRLDLQLRGMVAPYDRVLPDPARGDRLLFTAATEWELPDRHVPVRLDHDHRLVSVATLAELDDGLHVDAVIPGPLRRMVADRRELSIAISRLQTRPRPGGVLEVEACRLDEISLCRRGVWSPLTRATLIPLAA